MKYTPTTDPSVAPQYGQSGDSVRNLQVQLNQKGVGQQGYVPLKEDGLYGPKTRDAYNSSLGKSQLIIDAGKANDAYTKGKTYLDQHLTGMNQPTPDPLNDGSYSDSYTQGLDALSARSNASTKNLIATIRARHQNEVNDVTQNYDKYARGMELLGIENNQAQGTPELLAGQLLEIKNKKMDKIRALDSEEAKATLDAQNARDDNDFKVMTQKIDYIKQLKKIRLMLLKTFQQLKTSICRRPRTLVILFIMKSLDSVEIKNKRRSLQSVNNLIFRWCICSEQPQQQVRHA